MIPNLINLISNITLSMLVVSPTIFIFSVTLLGTAKEKSELEERAAQENDAKKNREEIQEVELAINEVKKNGNTQTLNSKLESLIINSKLISYQLKNIQNRYNRINLSNTVVYPCSAFIASNIVGVVAKSYLDKNVLFIILIAIQVVLMIYGIKKVFYSLSMIQDISSDKKDGENYERLRETIKLALTEYNQSTNEQAQIVFVEKAFPLNINSNTDLTLKFRAQLTKGRLLNNACVWFYIPDGFELIKPTEEASWRQASDFSTPNIRTIKISLGTLSTGPYTPRTIVVRTPLEVGKYTLYYKMFADGYVGPKQSIVLLVV